MTCSMTLLFRFYKPVQKLIYIYGQGFVLSLLVQCKEWEIHCRLVLKESWAVDEIKVPCMTETTLGVPVKVTAASLALSYDPLLIPEVVQHAQLGHQPAFCRRTCSGIPSSFCFDQSSTGLVWRQHPLLALANQHCCMWHILSHSALCWSSTPYRSNPSRDDFTSEW